MVLNAPAPAVHAWHRRSHGRGTLGCHFRQVLMPTWNKFFKSKQAIQTLGSATVSVHVQTECHQALKFSSTSLWDCRFLHNSTRRSGYPAGKHHCNCSVRPGRQSSTLRVVVHENGSLNGSSKLFKAKSNASLVSCTFLQPQDTF